MTTMAIRFRVHFDRETTLGPGKIDLLEQIERTGSLSKAARAMDMSYRRGWVLLNALNYQLRPTRGGHRQGGTQWRGRDLRTPFGRELIKVYRRFDTQLQEAGGSSPSADRAAGERSAARQGGTAPRP